MGVGVMYFSSARARRIGAARPNSLNVVKQSLSFTAKRPCCLYSRRNRGVHKDIPRGQGCRLVGETEEAGRNSFLRFVHPARKARTALSSVWGGMAGGGVLFKSLSASTLRVGEEKRFQTARFARWTRQGRSGNVGPENLFLGRITRSEPSKCRFPEPPRLFHDLLPLISPAFVPGRHASGNSPTGAPMSSKSKRRRIWRKARGRADHVKMRTFKTCIATSAA